MAKEAGPTQHGILVTFDDTATTDRQSNIKGPIFLCQSQIPPNTYISSPEVLENHEDHIE